MSRRFFVDSPINSEAVVLTRQEAQHVSKVMRAKVGDELILFDGSGTEFPARIETIGRSEVGLSIIARCEVDRELPFRLVIGVALPKGDRQRWLVEKLVELGVTEFVPLVTVRSVAQPSGNALVRLRHTVVEASKQCGRNRLMVVGQASTLEAFLTDSSEADKRLIAHPPTDGRAVFPRSTRADKVVAAIGPEGGFTDEEIRLADDHRWDKVSLGSRVLHSETAAIAIAAVIALQHKTND